MASTPAGLGRAVTIWIALLFTFGVPIALAIGSPLLAWREPIYIAAGLAGIIALLIMALQPLLVVGAVPGLPRMRGRRVHRWTGAALVLAVLVHVVGLWLTSPPDVIDALLFESPTPFSDWGVIAMWALLGAALLAGLRKHLRLTPRAWRMGHAALVSAAVIGTVIHAFLIEGTMEPLSKLALSVVVIAATATAFVTLRTFALRPRRKPTG